MPSLYGLIAAAPVPVCITGGAGISLLSRYILIQYAAVRARLPGCCRSTLGHLRALLVLSPPRWSSAGRSARLPYLAEHPFYKHASRRAAALRPARLVSRGSGDA